MTTDMHSGSAVNYSVSEHIATIELNRPDIRNSLVPEIVEGLVACLKKAESDSNVQVIILTGSGNSFCSGGNLSRISDGVSANRPPTDVIQWYKDSIHVIPLTISTIDKPLIAAVNGYALGAGCDLALMCDFRVVSEDAKFAELFVKVGLAPGDGGAFFLTRMVGMEKALELILSGETIDANEAKRIGMVGSVVPADALEKAAREFANKFVGGASQAQRLSKRAVYASLNQDLKTHLDMMAIIQATLDKTEDHKEALAAFAEKRSPVFKGV